MVLRQGNPLSQFLFTLVANTFSIIDCRAEDWSLVRGFSTGWNKIMVSHSQFTDDNILFSQARDPLFI